MRQKQRDNFINRNNFENDRDGKNIRHRLKTAVEFKGNHE